MPGTPTGDALREIDHLFRLGTLAGLSDGQLLERFVAGPEETAAVAFTAIVERHGAMVLRACRRELGNPHDAEDAAQVAFLALARGARSIRRRESAASWLLGVALRVARRARLDAARRQHIERGAARPSTAPHDEDRSDHDPAIFEELARLAERYRDPLVLCYLEGLTHEQAAHRLGLPLRTVQRRLTQGRERLRARLVRRGVAVSAGMLASEAGAAVLPEGWSMAVVRAALPMARRGTTLVAGSRLKVAATVMLAGLGALGLMPWASGEKPPANPPPAAVAKPAEGAGRVLHIQVVAADTDRPLAGAKVRITFPYTQREERLTVDAQGRVDFRHSTGPDDDWMAVEVSSEGYASRVYRWDPMPDEAIVRLRPGVFLGGAVTDDRGRPVSGASVYVSLDTIDHERDPLGAFDEMNVTATTGPDGRWQTRSAPEFSGISRIQIVHPEYYYRGWEKRKIPAADCRAGTATLVLSRTTPLEGRVIDADGQPVAGAAVTPAERSGLMPDDGGPTNLHAMDDKDSGTTDAEGRFRLPWVAGTLKLIAKAPGHATTLVDVREGDDVRHIEIRLRRPRPFRGRVVDSQGHPLAAVQVEHEPARGLLFFTPLSWTDAEGRFRADDMADGPFFLRSMQKDGYVSRYDERVEPSDDEVRFVLKRSLHLEGLIRSTSGRAIPYDEHNAVEVGLVDPKTGAVAWKERHSIANGFAVLLDAEAPEAYRLRFSAQGYKPFLSREFKGDERDVKYDVKLEPEKGEPKDEAPKLPPVVGTVVDPDGKPLAGATVTLGGAIMSHVILADGRLVPSREGEFRNPTPIATTGADGRFSIAADVPAGTGDFPPLPGRYDTVVVIHDRFFGKAEIGALTKDSTIKVEPWGRVEGVLQSGDRPAAGLPLEYVFAHADGFAAGVVIVGKGTTSTDAQGRFTFERVVPGGVRIEQRTGAVRDPWGSARGVFAFVKPGEPARVVLGGPGRAVIGRVTPPEGIDLGADPAAVVDVAIESDGLGPAEERKALEKKLPGLGKEEQKKIYKRLNSLWRWTTLDGLEEAEPKRWWEALNELADAGRRWVRVGRAAIDRDLRFRVDDLPPGPYRIKVAVRAGRGAEWSGQFQIPEPVAGKDAGPIDVGTLRPEPKQLPPTGEGIEPKLGAG